jgi:uncharacterized membrane-anchored protein
MHTPTRRGSALVKVPEVTTLFWLIKILTTGVGESTSDFLVKADRTGGRGLPDRNRPRWIARLAIPVPALHTIYWLAVAMVAVFGT